MYNYMDSENNEKYEPVVPNYYNYKARDNLKLDMPLLNIKNYENIYICSYTVNNDGKYPFLRFLLTNTFISETLVLPKLPVFRSFTSLELINYSKVYLFGLLLLNNFAEFEEVVEFNGFYEYNRCLYLFYDTSKCKLQINDIYSENHLWLTLIDEIVNQKHLCKIPIDCSVSDFFILNDEFCFLHDENNNGYEIPIVSYTGKPENRLNFTYVFGQTMSDKNGILGPYYYFTDYDTAFNEAVLFTTDTNEYKKTDIFKINTFEKGGLVRFAVFLGRTKYFENHINDAQDESDIKMERLQDETLDQNMERLLLRVSDHDGKWAAVYDSAYLGNVELDNGHFLEKSILATKEYNQQIPLSYHFVDKKTASSSGSYAYVTANQHLIM